MLNMLFTHRCGFGEGAVLPAGAAELPAQLAAPQVLAAQQLPAAPPAQAPQIPPEVLEWDAPLDPWPRDDLANEARPLPMRVGCTRQHLPCSKSR
jgi:hypothetical protein